MIRLKNEETPFAHCKDAEKTRHCRGRCAAGAQIAIRLFDRNEGEAANWPLIAETLFKAAFDALDKSPDDMRRTMLLRHVHAGSYERLAADPATNKTQVPAGQNGALQAEFKSPGPGAADAFRNTV